MNQHDNDMLYVYMYMYECFEIFHFWTYDLSGLSKQNFISVRSKGHVCGLKLPGTEVQFHYTCFFFVKVHWLSLYSWLMVYSTCISLVGFWTLGYTSHFKGQKFILPIHVYVVTILRIPQITVVCQGNTSLWFIE